MKAIGFNFSDFPKFFKFPMNACFADIHKIFSPIHYPYFREKY